MSLGGRLVGILLLVVPAFAQRAPLFQDEVLPVFQQHCVACHGAKQKKAGLDLSSFAGLMAGAKRGPVIAPNHPERSVLWKLVESGAMPKGGDQLTPAEKQLIRTYIQQGRFPAAISDVELEAREKALITPSDREWWSFRTPRKPVVPAVADGTQIKTPIDAFIAAKLEERGWKMEAEAARATLIRRAYLDLTGLLPTPQQVQFFEEDPSPNAYEKMVDQLLTSPHYGEEWGRHWLDIAGYSDSVGEGSDSERQYAWKYRDYVIHAFNQNKPYDRFILEQFAGDQLVNYQPFSRPAPKQLEAVTATGFLRMTSDMTDNSTIYQTDKYFDVQQRVMETSLKAVLGLSIHCARCHDHKFDPILQRDYYRLMAVYQPTWDPENWLGGSVEHSPKPWPSRMVLDIDPAMREIWIKQLASPSGWRRGEAELSQAYKRYRATLEDGQELTDKVRSSILKEIAATPDLSEDDTTAQSFISNQELERRYPELAAKRASIEARRRKSRITYAALFLFVPMLAAGGCGCMLRLRPTGWREAAALGFLMAFSALLLAAHFSMARKYVPFHSADEARISPNYIMAAWDVSKTPSPTYILQRGNYLAPGAMVGPGVPYVLDDPNQPFRFPNPQQHPEWSHTGRRLALAKWLVNPCNPLTARVFVNRVWQLHFGKGIVASVDDFGSQGARPTHPELLDWLAVSFVEHGWDVKWLHKQIMMSQAYRQASGEQPGPMAADPSNKLLWRKAPLRLDAESIRDTMLQVGGLLNDQMGGHQVAVLRGPDGQWMENPDDPAANRRSVYLAYSRTKPQSFLRAFDCPDMTTNSQTERLRSALPSQSLAMLNDTIVARASSGFASRMLEQAGGNVEEALRGAYRTAYLRQPHEDELELLKEAVASSGDGKKGLRLYLQAMLGANEFLYSF